MSLNMKNLNSIVRGHSLLKRVVLLVCLMLGAVSPARAGEWVLDRYICDVNKEALTYSKHTDGTIKQDNHRAGYWPGDPWVDLDEQHETHFEWPAENGAIYASSGVDVFGSNATATVSPVTLRMSITPVYKWQGGGVPSPELFVRERGAFGSAQVHYRNGYYTTDYTEAEQYNGEHAEEKELEGSTGGFNGFKDGFNDPSAFVGHPARYEGGTSWDTWVKWVDKWHVFKYSTKGKTEIKGQTRTLGGKLLTTKGVELRGGDWPRFFTWIDAAYEAEVCAFNIGVDLSYLIREDGVHLNQNDPNSPLVYHPRRRSLVAYAHQGAKYPWDEAQKTRFWDGTAQYSANLSNKLLETIGTPTYSWNSERVTPPSMLTESPSQAERDEGTVDASTRIKALHHDVNDIPKPPSPPATWPQSTKTRVIVSGSNVETGLLTAKAKIEWWPKPKTYIKTYTQIEVIDLDTGDVTPLTSYAGLDDEQEDIDAYIADIEATKDEAFETGKALIQVALEGEMMVGSWFVPEKEDVYLGVGGIAAGKLFRMIKAATVTARVLSTLHKIGDNTLAGVKRVRTNLGQSTNVVLRMTTRTYVVGRMGKPPVNGRIADNVVEEMKDAKRIFKGVVCFVAGTPVLMADGSSMPIEQIQTGDMVLSKDEAAGRLEPKKVTQTFITQARATLLLTLSSGERIETTAEHPFFLSGKGFQPAALLEIGDRIETSSGTVLKIVQSEEKNEPTTVYNLAVGDFHTYFVGESKVWVHNLSCSLLTAAQDKANALLNVTPRPTTACAIEVPGHAPFVGGSRKGGTNEDWYETIDDRVKQLYAEVELPGGVPRPPWHGFCAEVEALSNMGLVA
jgi:hypothetical protein